MRSVKIHSFRITKEKDLMVIFNNGSVWFPSSDDLANINNKTGTLRQVKELINNIESRE